MTKKKLVKSVMAGLFAAAVVCTSLPVTAYAENPEGELYTVDGKYYYEPLEQGEYSNGGYTVEKISHPDRGAGELDSILDPEERGQSYSWSMAEYGDYVYIGTCYNSTYYIYYNNVLTTLKGMQTSGTISGEVNVDQVTKDILEVAFGVDAFDQDGNPMSWKPVIMAVNKHTGKAEVIFREAEIVKDHPEMFPFGFNVLSGYRMSFEFKGKIYFAGMGNPTATLVEVDPMTNETQIVYYNINRSNAESTAAYGSVGNGVHGLLVFDDEILMCYATDDLNKDGSETIGDIGGVIVASSDPSAGLDSWRVIGSQKDFDNLPAVMQIDGLNGGGIWDIIEYNGSVYVTIVTDKTDPATGETNKQGFALYRGDKQADDSFIWTQIAGNNEESKLPFGFGINYSMSCNMWVYNDYLYFGTYNDPMLDLAAVPASGNFEHLYNDLDHSIYLYRMNEDEEFEMIAGKDDNPVFPDGPQGNLGAGLGNNSNQYVWRFGEHNGELYIGTYDTSTLTYMFTQLTDGQVKDMSEEEISARAAELEKALLEVLQQNDNKLLAWFIENTLLSGTSQKLFQQLSGIASEHSKDKNPVPDYREAIANYELLKDWVMQKAGSISTYSMSPSDTTEIEDADEEALMNMVEEVIQEEELNDPYLNVDQFIDSLNDGEIEKIYDETVGGIALESVNEAKAGVDDGAARSVAEMRFSLKELLKASLETLFENLDKVFYDDLIHNFVFYFGVNYYAQYCEPGFDLLVSNDGVNFDAITRDGFGDGKNHGLRTIESTEQGVYTGTANPFLGTQLWRIYSDADLKLDTDPDAVRHNITVTSDGNGEVSASQTTAVEGKYVKLTVQANTGYQFKGWKVISPAGLEIDNDMFRIPDEDVEIKALFESIDPETGDQPGEETGDQPGGETGDQPGEETGDQPGEETGDQPGEETGDQPGEETGDQPGEETGDQPGGETEDQPGEETGDPSGGKTENQSDGKINPQSDGKEKVNVVKTGDQANVVLWAALAGGSILCAIFVLFRKRNILKRK